MLAAVWCACAALATAGAAPPVTVVHLRLEYGQQHEMLLNSTVEYIIDFVPPAEEEAEPALLHVSSSGGDLSQPVLLTARHRAGATTWQLPYESGATHQLELQRTLCPDDTAQAAADRCGGADAQGAARGAFSLHVSTSCRAELRVRVAARRAPGWRLPFAAPVALAATPTAPRVLHYEFAEAQHSVRLVVQSDDDVCASISVQNYSCPIAQTLADISVTGLRMTVQRSGAVQLSRQQFPRGFLVVAVVQPSQTACGGAADEHADWLWAAAVFGETPQPPAPLARTKTFTLTVEAALTRAQYAAATAATAALFLAFYAACGALVLAQRWPPFGRLVRPKAVLADASVDTTAAEEARAPRTHGEAVARRRRASLDTFDSSDGSSSEEEETSAGNATRTPGLPLALPTAQPDAVAASTPSHAAASQVNEQTSPTEQQGPFGLPAELRLARLARRRERTLRSRSDRYLYTLATVAVFYALPVLQFVAVIKIILNVSGSLDICYYNFLCAHPAGALSDFNHVLSNVGYLLLGALFLLQVRRRRVRRRRHPRHEEYGIPAHYGLLSALGASMMVVAVLSASYHVCPNKINFQFDTAFMYVLAVLSMVKIYQSRHPDVNARAHATFGALAVLIAVVVWGVLGGGPLFWGAWSVLHVFTFLLLSLRIYYVGQFRLEKESLQEAARELRRSARPLYSARLALLLIGNALNWLIAVYGLVRQSSDFAGHMLQVLLGNTLLYMLSYLLMKLVQGERLRWYAWCWLAGAAAAWVPALYFFLSGSSDWSVAPAISRHRNHHCMVMQFYDAHDLWHILSAVALYFSFNAMMTWDDGLSAVKKTDIPVF
ncbi:SID1 transmembrane family member 1-like isoform X2 [Battus philenor]|uniref:SID1 transmembrane family member 1-like isoform X2 n=1 Tax=Battus philenor TaxID=42288 RepID=UPI0035D062B5